MTVGHLQRILEDIPKDAEIRLVTKDPHGHLEHLEIHVIKSELHAITYSPDEAESVIHSHVTNYESTTTP